MFKYLLKLQASSDKIFEIEIKIIFQLKERRICLTEIRGVNKYYYFMSNRRAHYMAVLLVFPGIQAS